MGKLITVSAKVDERLKKKAEALGINISALVRKALEEEVRRLEVEEIVEKLKSMVEKGPELPKGYVVKMIREMREGGASGVL